MASEKYDSFFDLLVFLENIGLEGVPPVFCDLTDAFLDRFAP